jgi:mono/diheme cytochrome c family protein
MRRISIVALAAWGLAACQGVELQNLQPAQDLAQRSQPPGSVYTGWRVFQDRCAGCHGADAIGSAGGPDLLPRVRTMGPRQFMSVVLTRYDWQLPGPSSGTTVDEVMQRKQGLLTMPAWQGEPRVSAHIADLHAYLSARATGTQAPGRPSP